VSLSITSNRFLKNGEIFSGRWCKTTADLGLSGNIMNQRIENYERGDVMDVEITFTHGATRLLGLLCEMVN
jgi:hypothetical protein